MSTERTIPTPAQADVVTTTIMVNGSAIDDTVQLMSVYISKGVNMVPYARLKIRDGDPAAEDFPASNSETFVPGNEIEIHAGYRSEEEVILKASLQVWE